MARVGVGLRPVLPDDLDALRRIELSPRNLTRWRFAGEVPSPAEYRALLWSGVLEQRVVTSLTSPEPIGLVNAHRADLRSGTAWLGVVEREDLHGHGFGLAGLVLFVDWLFDTWPFRALHAEVNAANLGQFASALDGYAVESGRLRERFRRGADRSDAVLLTLRRDDWLANARPRVRKEPVANDRRPVTFADVREVVASHGVDADGAGPETALAELGLDSLGVIEVLDEIEQRLGCPLPSADTVPLSTLGDLWRLTQIHNLA